jgi:hypothetical protein
VGNGSFKLKAQRQKHNAAFFFCVKSTAQRQLENWFEHSFRTACGVLPFGFRRDFTISAIPFHQFQYQFLYSKTHLFLTGYSPIL